MSSGPERVHHGIGSRWSLSFGCWGNFGSREENVEEIGVEQLGNRGERHDLGGCSSTGALNGRRRHAGSYKSERRDFGIRPLPNSTKAGAQHVQC